MPPIDNSKTFKNYHQELFCINRLGGKLSQCLVKIIWAIISRILLIKYIGILIEERRW